MCIYFPKSNSMFNDVDYTKCILLLGATGRTGKEVLHQALELGYYVTALVRDSSKIVLDSPLLKIIEGDTRLPSDLNRAIEGCGAVISCLNISRKSDFPWSPLRTPENFLSLTMRSLINTCKEHGVNRLIFTSAWGVGDSRPYTPGWFAWIIDNSNLSAAYLEHERQEAMVRNSGLNWTIIRPVGLVNRKKTKPVRYFLNNEGKPAMTISRRDTARFILETLSDEKFYQTIPVISS